jgi:hypothetical protein
METQPVFKSRLEFSSPEAWQDYVRTAVPAPLRAFTLTFGQTTLYLRFYEVRDQAFPVELSVELKRIEGMDDPQRTEALETLNGRIFAEMSRFLMNAMPPVGARPFVETADEGVDRLLVYLEKENPAFALWLSYKRAQSHQQSLPTWEEYVHALLAGDTDEDLEFVLLMSQLGELLYQFRSQHLVLSSQLSQRIRAIHLETAGKVRALTARLLVYELLEAITPCTSA